MTAALVRELMSTDPGCLSPEDDIQSAARLMADRDIGDVLVCDREHHLLGIVTDRDIAVRAVAQGKGPTTPLSDVYSGALSTLNLDDSADHAIELMRLMALRRLPVVDDGQAVGVVSIGDLAQAMDADSALAKISSAPANI
jgi:CBS domain-containing protein